MADRDAADEETAGEEANVAAERLTGLKRVQRRPGYPDLACL